MSRDIVDKLSFFVLVLGLVGAVGVQFKLAGELSVLGQDPDVSSGHQQDDPLTAVGPPDPDLAQVALVTQRDIASLVTLS
jgi:hypothetical protein